MLALGAVLAVEHHRFHGPGVDYAAVGAAAALSWLVMTGPGEAALIAAGVAAARHRVDIGSILLVAWAGAMIGGIGGWLVGLKGGRAVVLAPGPLLGKRRRMVASGERLFARYGPLAVYVAPTWMAGIHGMRWSRFLPANAIAALVWTLLVGLGAFLVGPPIEEVISDVGLAGIVLLVLLACAGVLARVLHVRRRA